MIYSLVLIIQSLVPSLTIQLNIQPICNLEPYSLVYNSSNCLSYSYAYAYDAARNACLLFIYNGCGGNANRFKNIADCERACMGDFAESKQLVTDDDLPSLRSDREWSAVVKLGESSTVPKCTIWDITKSYQYPMLKTATISIGITAKLKNKRFARPIDANAMAIKSELLESDLNMNLLDLVMKYTPYQPLGVSHFLHVLLIPTLSDCDEKTIRELFNNPCTDNSGRTTPMTPPTTSTYAHETDHTGSTESLQSQSITETSDGNDTGSAESLESQSITESSDGNYTGSAESLESQSITETSETDHTGQNMFDMNLHDMVMHFTPKQVTGVLPLLHVILVPPLCNREALAIKGILHNKCMENAFNDSTATQPLPKPTTTTFVPDTDHTKMTEPSSSQSTTRTSETDNKKRIEKLYKQTITVASETDHIEATESTPRTSETDNIKRVEKFFMRTKVPTIETDNIKRTDSQTKVPTIETDNIKRTDSQSRRVTTTATEKPLPTILVPKTECVRKGATHKRKCDPFTKPKCVWIKSRCEPKNNLYFEEFPCICPLIEEDKYNPANSNSNGVVCHRYIKEARKTPCNPYVRPKCEMEGDKCVKKDDAYYSQHPCHCPLSQVDNEQFIDYFE